MSNIWFHKAANGFRYEKPFATAVGDRSCTGIHARTCLSVGGEQSGHVIFLDHNTTGDGMLTAVQVAALVKEKGQPLSELASIMTKYPTKYLSMYVLPQKTGWGRKMILSKLLS